jgi:hypothetical protein
MKQIAVQNGPTEDEIITSFRTRGPVPLQTENGVFEFKVTGIEHSGPGAWLVTGWHGRNRYRIQYDLAARSGSMHLLA